MTTAEFCRPVRIDTIGEAPRALTVVAEADERAALARRFGLLGIDRLEAEVELKRKGVEIVARGRIGAEVVQSCVASGEPVPATIDEPFELLFRPAPETKRPDEEVELSEAELDVIFHDGAAIDLGEAVAEKMALALDPYPRAPGADAALKAAGVKSEEEAGPFGALAGLRDRLEKRST